MSVLYSSCLQKRHLHQDSYYTVLKKEKCFWNDNKLHHLATHTLMHNSVAQNGQKFDHAAKAICIDHLNHIMLIPILYLVILY